MGNCCKSKPRVLEEKGAPPLSVSSSPRGGDDGLSAEASSLTSSSSSRRKGRSMMRIDSSKKLTKEQPTGTRTTTTILGGTGGREDGDENDDDDEAKKSPGGAVSPSSFASSRSDIERAIQKHHLRGMNQHLFEKYETIFTSNESIRWPEKTEVNEDYLNEFKEAHRRQRSFGKFLAFHERTEENESVWFEGEYLASETHDSNRSKRRVKMQIEPWDDHEWTSRKAFEIYVFVMTHLRVNGVKQRKQESGSGGLTRRRSMESSAPADESESALYLPDTRKMHNKEERMKQLIRGLGSEYMNHPLFYFCVNFFEGVNLDSDNEELNEKDYVYRCELFLYRCLEGCQGAAFSKFKDKRLEFGMKHISDSQHLGAVAYLKAYVNTRFLKRFPITTNFMHPKLDSQIERIRLSRDVAHKMRTFTFVEASDSHPAALVLSFPDSKAFKDLLTVGAPDCWLALNHFYEWTIAQPNRTRPRDKKLQTPPIFIADVKNLSLMSCTKKNVVRLADTFRVAMFHPEPFSKFVIANAPMSVMALFTFGKLFMSESARLKFVMTGSSLQKAIKQAWGLEIKDIPECLGGKGQPRKALTVEDILTSKDRWLHHKQCIERTRKRYPKYFAKYSEKYLVDERLDGKQAKTMKEHKSKALANSQREEDEGARASASFTGVRYSKTMPRMGNKEKDDETMFARVEEEEMSERKKMAFLFLCIVLASLLSMLFKVFVLSNNKTDKINIPVP